MRFDLLALGVLHASVARECNRARERKEKYMSTTTKTTNKPFKTKREILCFALWEFVEVFPDIWKRLCKQYQFDKYFDTSDKDYLIKIDLETGNIEIGYKTDIWSM